MKKLFLAILVTILSYNRVAALELIPLITSPNENEQPGSHGYPKTPMTAPTVYIDNYTLLFEASHPEYVLYIKDEDDNVVYSTVVYSTQTHVVLPSTLWRFRNSLRDSHLLLLRVYLAVRQSLSGSAQNMGTSSIFRKKTQLSINLTWNIYDFLWRNN